MRFIIKIAASASSDINGGMKLLFECGKSCNVPPKVGPEANPEFCQWKRKEVRTSSVSASLKGSKLASTPALYVMLARVGRVRDSCAHARGRACLQHAFKAQQYCTSLPSELLVFGL